MTTGIDRLVAAMTGAPCDRIPIFCNVLDHGARAMGVGLKEYYADGELVAEGQVRMRERFGHDNVWSLFYVGKEAELLGCRKILFAPDGPPNVGEYIIREPRDIEALEVPRALEDHPAFIEQSRCLAALRREVGGRYPICAYITATMTLPVLLMGMERWLEFLLLGPFSARDELLAKCHEFFVRETAAFRAAGADVIVYSNPFGATEILPMNLFLDLSLPWIQKDITAVGSQGVVYYCGTARFNPVLDIVLESTGIGAYYLSPLDDISEAKRILGASALTCGIINDIRMVEWSPEEIRSEVRRIIGTGKPGGRFLFGTGVMPYAIPEEKIRVMMEEALACGVLEAS